MELKTYLEILWRRKWVIIITVVVTIAVVAIGIRRITPTYVASATVRVTPATNDGVDYGELMYLERLMNTYAQLVASGPVLEQARQQLGIAEPLETLRDKIQVKFPANTELMQVTVEDRNPSQAAAVANTVANILIDQSRTTRVGRAYTTALVDPAIAPRSPDKPRKALAGALAAMIGLAGGVGLAFLFENLDTRLHTTTRIHEVTNVSTLGKIPTLKQQQRLVFQNGTSPGGEAFRYLRTNLFVLHSDIPWQTLLVTSAEPHEGKSTIVTNLAFTMAQSGRKVVVVDGDLRRPTLHKNFGLANEIGLSNVLQHEIPLEMAVQVSAVSGVSVLTSGPLPRHPTELLASPHMAATIKQLAQQFDTVLLDAPAYLAVADAATLVPIVDGVLLVVGRAQVRREAVEAVRQQLAQARAQLIGVIVNHAEQDNSYYAHYMSRR